MSPEKIKSEQRKQTNQILTKGKKQKQVLTEAVKGNTKEYRIKYLTCKEWRRKKKKVEK